MGLRVTPYKGSWLHEQDLKLVGNQPRQALKNMALALSNTAEDNARLAAVERIIRG